MQWLIVADAGSARFFDMDEENKTLVEIHTFVHPEARLRAADVYDGHLGRKSGAGMAPHTPREDVEDEQFARLVASEVKKRINDFDRLHLAAPPRFLGHLRKQLHKTVTRKLSGTLSKDLTHLSAHELVKVIDL